jgi:hypothetical protein
MQLNGAERPAAQQDTSIGQQPYNKAALALVALNSAQVQQPQNVPQPCSAAALLSGPAATAEVRAEPESRTHGRGKRSRQGPQPQNSKRQRQEAPASATEQPDQRNNEHAAPTAPEDPQQEQPARIHPQQQPQPQQASRLSLAEMPTAPLQAAPQLAPEQALQHPSLYDLLMDAMQQPAAAAGLTAEMAVGFLGLLPVQADTVRCRLLRWLAGCDCCKDSYRSTAALYSCKLMSLSIFRWEAPAIHSTQHYRCGLP